MHASLSFSFRRTSSYCILQAVWRLFLFNFPTPYISSLTFDSKWQLFRPICAFTVSELLLLNHDHLAESKQSSGKPESWNQTSPREHSFPLKSLSPISVFLLHCLCLILRKRKSFHIFHHSLKTSCCYVFSSRCFHSCTFTSNLLIFFSVLISQQEQQCFPSSKNSHCRTVTVHL